MNALLNAQHAYAPAHSIVRAPKTIESDAFGKVTKALRDSLLAEGNFKTRTEALFNNRKLWSAIAIAVADKDNALSQDLRAQLYYLAEFSEHESQLALDPEHDIQPLIDINTAILRGLTGSGASQ